MAERSLIVELDRKAEGRTAVRGARVVDPGLRGEVVPVEPHHVQIPFRIAFDPRPRGRTGRFEPMPFVHLHRLGEGQSAVLRAAHIEVPHVREIPHVGDRHLILTDDRQIDRAAFAGGAHEALVHLHGGLEGLPGQGAGQAHVGRTFGGMLDPTDVGDASRRDPEPRERFFAHVPIIDRDRGEEGLALISRPRETDFEVIALLTRPKDRDRLPRSRGDERRARDSQNRARRNRHAGAERAPAIVGAGEVDGGGRRIPSIGPHRIEHRARAHPEPQIGLVARAEAVDLDPRRKIAALEPRCRTARNEEGAQSEEPVHQPPRGNDAQLPNSRHRASAQSSRRSFVGVARWSSRRK